MMILGIVVFITIFGCLEEDMELGKWILLTVLMKVVGLGVGFIMYKLFVYWDKNNLIPELSKLIEEE